MRLTFILVTISLFFTACTSIKKVKDYSLSNKNKIGKIQILSSKSLKFPDYNGRTFAGVSDLAWDKNKQILYALTDRATLFHLKLNVDENKITTVSVIDAYALKDKQGKRLSGKKIDSEGMDLHYGANQQAILSISFERHPRIVQYTSEGGWISELSLPNKLTNIKLYRSSNKALESTVNHSLYGTITAAEYPLKNHNKKQHVLYGLSGKEWRFKASNAKNSAITALEELPNNNLLVLERAWAGFLRPLVINLSEVMINNCAQGNICTSKNLAQLSTADGWRLDNFEGLTEYKDGQYLMISDDNASPIQHTLLVLFEVRK